MLLFPVINFKLQVFIITQEQIFLTGDFGFLKEKRNELQNGKTCGSVKRLYWSFPYQLQSVETSIRPLLSRRKDLVLTSLFCLVVQRSYRKKEEPIKTGIYPHRSSATQPPYCLYSHQLVILCPPHGGLRAFPVLRQRRPVGFVSPGFPGFTFIGLF